MGVSRNIDITARQRKTILELLGRYLPNVTVWVYGSRVRWTSRPQSDLDMVAFASPEQKSQVAALKEAFEESGLPFRVDLFVWDEVPEQFRRNIEAEHVVLVERADDLIMGGGWEEVSLTDLYDIKSGLSKPAKEFGSGYPFLAFKDVFNNFFVPDVLSQLVRSNEKDREGCSIQRGDVFLTRTSETMHELGMSCVALSDYENATFNGFTKRLRPKEGAEILPEYVGYYLRSPKFRNAMMAFSTMSTRASLNNQMISQMKLTMPPVKEQKSIAWVLRGLDLKVELNRKMNKTLEAMAQAFFKSWFVDFDPFRDGGMVDSELGPVPKGWEVMALDNVAEFLNGAACQKYPAIADEDSLPVIKIRELSQGVTQQTDKATASIPAKWIVEDGDILFSWSGSLMVKIWTGGKGALNQHLFKVTSKQFPKWFYYLWTKYHLEKFQGIAADKATTMGHIKRKNLSDAKVVVPAYFTDSGRAFHSKPAACFTPFGHSLIGA